MSTDVEIWMLFAPFWLLGICAAVGALWHFSHLGKHLHPHGMTAESRHHFKWAQIALMACIGLLVLGLGLGALQGVLRG